ncbi:sensor domain-containing diguanylate cyclase [Phytobacter sp. RSE-02]|uniref:sensor domain-containing diguanylate cyclase n=1 Tax=Phytobacter sp. RSE-02 TaxID=3229229 RepID=UPI00339D6DA1
MFKRDLTNNTEYAKIQALDNTYGVVEFDIVGMIKNVNKIFCKLSGYDKNELINQPHHMLFVSDEAGEHEKWWRQLAEGKIRKGEFIRKRKNGSIFWIYATYTRIINHQGIFIGVVKIAQNITVLRQEEIERSYKSKAINMAQGIIEFDTDGYILKANKNYLDICHFSLSEIKGHHHKELCEDDYADSAEYNKFWEKLCHGNFIDGRFKRIGKNKSAFWIHATYCPLRDSYGNVYKIVKYAYDITDEIISNQLSHSRGEILSLLVKMHDGFLNDHDTEKVCKSILPELVNVTGAEHASVILNKKSTKLFHSSTKLKGKNDEKQILNILNENLLTDQLNKISTLCSGCYSFLSDSVFPVIVIPISFNEIIYGHLCLFQKSIINPTHLTMIQPVIKTLGEMLRFYDLNEERKRAERDSQFNAEHDFLTGMYNRGFFHSEANRQISLFNGNERHSLVIIDIDHFKKINDIHGHPEGDKVIIGVSQIIQSHIRAGDICARFGGEEFILLLKNVDAYNAFVIVNRIRILIAESLFMASGGIIPVTVSAGISEWKEGLRLGEWESASDRMLYAAKNSGRNKIKWIN